MSENLPEIHYEPNPEAVKKAQELETQNQSVRIVTNHVGTSLIAVDRTTHVAQRIDFPDD